MTPERDPFAGPWFDAKTAAAYVPCTDRHGQVSLNAWYSWRRRHGILARNNGSVLKRDLDRELKRRKPRRRMHPASLANLKQQQAVA